MLSTPARHLRGNAIAYVALFLALGGTSYAATQLPKNSVGARQITAGAVRSSEVKNRSLKAADFARGQFPRGEKGPAGAPGPQGAQGGQGPQGPPGATFAVAQTGNATDPPAVPDGNKSPGIDGRRLDFTLPRAGKVLLRTSQNQYGINCSAGTRRAGLYLDGAPLPSTSKPVQDQAGKLPEEWVAVVQAGAGDHTALLIPNCPTGNLALTTWDGGATWSAVLLAE